MAIGIVGGGIMGVSVGYFLARRGLPVEIFEASPTLGGLAGPLVLPDGTSIDRYIMRSCRATRTCSSYAASWASTIS